MFKSNGTTASSTTAPALGADDLGPHPSEPTQPEAPTTLEPVLATLEELPHQLAPEFEPSTMSFEDFESDVNQIALQMGNGWYSYCALRYGKLFDLLPRLKNFVAKSKDISDAAISTYQQSLATANGRLRDQVKNVILDKFQFNTEKETHLEALRQKKAAQEDRARSLRVKITGRPDGELILGDSKALNNIMFVALAIISLAEVAAGFATFKSQSDPWQAAAASVLYVFTIIISATFSAKALSRVLGHHNAAKAYRSYKDSEGKTVEVDPLDSRQVLVTVLSSLLFLTATVGVFLWRWSVAKTGDILAGSPVIAAIQGLAAVAYLLTYLHFGAQHEGKAVEELTALEDEIRYTSGDIDRVAKSVWIAPFDGIHGDYLKELDATREDATAFATESAGTMDLEDFIAKRDEFFKLLPEYEEERKTVLEKAQEAFHTLCKLIFMDRSDLDREKFKLEDPENVAIVEHCFVAAIENTPSLAGEPTAGIREFNPVIDFTSAGSDAVNELGPMVEEVEAHELQKIAQAAEEKRQQEQRLRQEEEQRQRSIQLEKEQREEKRKRDELARQRQARRAVVPQQRSFNQIRKNLKKGRN